jgi:uncharacterized protein with GYD domain
MPHYVILTNWTDQGIRAVKDSAARYDAFKDMVRQHGGREHSAFMTMGAYDLVVICELPSDEDMAQIALKLAAGGNVRTQTMKAFSEADYRRITAAIT